MMFTPKLLEGTEDHILAPKWQHSDRHRGPQHLLGGAGILAVINKHPQGALLGYSLSPQKTGPVSSDASHIKLL